MSEDISLEKQFRKAVLEASCILIGMGAEWETGKGISAGNGEEKREEVRKDRQTVRKAYETLRNLMDGKDYFIITTVTDGLIRESSLDQSRIVAPCGNEQWKQCSRACTKDIWEPGEVENGLCPHCGAPLAGNTICTDTYMEEGYLPQWKAYQAWLSRTLNRELLAVELGEGFLMPKLIRWPFEKIVFFNRKAHMYRINETFSQVSEDIAERTISVAKNSVDFITGKSEEAEAKGRGKQ